MALQFPEGLLMYACIIADILERCVWWEWGPAEERGEGRLGEPKARRRH